MGKEKLEWDEFPGKGRYFTVFLPTGRKDKNVAKLQRCIDYYEERGYKLHSFTTSETPKSTATHYIVFEKVV